MWLSLGTRQTCLCHCPVCGGKPRNRKTIRKHFSSNPFSVEERPTTVIKNTHPAPADSHLNTDSCLETAAIDLEEDHSVTSVDSQDETTIQTQLAANNEDESSEDDEETTHHNVAAIKYSEEEITNVILRTIEAKVKHGWSQVEALTQLRSIYEITKDERIPHQSWDAVIKYLKKLCIVVSMVSILMMLLLLLLMMLKMIIAMVMMLMTKVLYSESRRRSR